MATKVTGVRLETQGLSQFLAQLAQADAAVQRIGKGAGGAITLPAPNTSGVASAFNSISAQANASAGNVQGSFSKAFNFVENLAIGATRRIGSYLADLALKTAGEAVSQPIDFEFGLDQLQAAAVAQGATQAQINALGPLALQVALDPTISAGTGDVLDVATILLQSGVTPENLEATLKPTIALGNATLKPGESEKTVNAVAAELTAKALGIFEGETAVNITDIFTGAFARGGFKNLNDFRYAFLNSAGAADTLGVSLLDLGTGLTFIQKAFPSGRTAGTGLAGAFQKLAKPSDDATAAMQELGFSAFDLKGGFIGIPSLINRLSASLAGLSQEKKLNLLTRVFGADFDVILALLDGGVEGFEQLRAEVADTSAYDVAAQRTGNVRSALNQLGDTVEGLSIAFAAPFLPDIETGIRSFTALLAGGFGSLAGAGESIHQAFAPITAELDALRADGVITISEIFNSLTGIEPIVLSELVTFDGSTILQNVREFITELGALLGFGAGATIGPPAPGEAPTPPGMGPRMGPGEPSPTFFSGFTGPRERPAQPNMELPVLLDIPALFATQTAQIQRFFADIRAGMDGISMAVTGQDLAANADTVVAFFNQVQAYIDRVRAAVSGLLGTPTTEGPPAPAQTNVGLTAMAIPTLFAGFTVPDFPELTALPGQLSLKLSTAFAGFTLPDFPELALIPGQIRQRIQDIFNVSPTPTVDSTGMPAQALQVAQGGLLGIDFASFAAQARQSAQEAFSAAFGGEGGLTLDIPDAGKLTTFATAMGALALVVPGAGVIAGIAGITAAFARLTGIDTINLGPLADGLGSIQSLFAGLSVDGVALDTTPLSDGLGSIQTLFGSLAGADLSSVEGVVGSISGLIQSLLGSTSGAVDALNQGAGGVSTGIDTFVSAFVNQTSAALSAADLPGIAAGATGLVRSISQSIEQAVSGSDTGLALAGLGTNLIGQITRTLIDPAVGSDVGAAVGNLTGGLVGSITLALKAVNDAVAEGAGTNPFQGFADNVYGGLASELASVNYAALGVEIKRGIEGALGVTPEQQAARQAGRATSASQLASVDEQLGTLGQTRAAQGGILTQQQQQQATALYTEQGQLLASQNALNDGFVGLYNVVSTASGAVATFFNPIRNSPEAQAEVARLQTEQNRAGEVGDSAEVIRLQKQIEVIQSGITLPGQRPTDATQQAIDLANQLNIPLEAFTSSLFDFAAAQRAAVTPEQQRSLASLEQQRVGGAEGVIGPAGVTVTASSVTVTGGREPEVKFLEPKGLPDSVTVRREPEERVPALTPAQTLPIIVQPPVQPVEPAAPVTPAKAPEPIDVTKVIPKIAWPTFVPKIAWGTFVPSLSWGTFVSNLNLAQFVTPVDLNAVVGPVDLSKFVTPVDLSKFVTGGGSSSSSSGGNTTQRQTGSGTVVAKAAGDSNYKGGAGIAGEFGRELYVTPAGKSGFLGENGVERFTLPRGSVIYDALKTEELTGGQRVAAYASGVSPKRPKPVGITPVRPSASAGKPPLPSTSPILGGSSPVVNPPKSLREQRERQRERADNIRNVLPRAVRKSPEFRQFAEPKRAETARLIEFLGNVIVRQDVRPPETRQVTRQLIQNYTDNSTSSVQNNLAVNALRSTESVISDFAILKTLAG